MKSANNSRKLRARVISIAVCAALILCTALSFCFINTKPIKSSAEEARVSETGIRFVQVAAGDDFAIGLTYNGDLYGWSLLDEEYCAQAPDSANTLGEYYTKTPRQIPVIFRKGPGVSGAQTRWNIPDYHTAIDLNKESSKSTKIVEVVATRTTAAFITENGFIYTWGKDPADISGGYSNETEHYLLLRNPDDSHDNPWYIPYIIDYGHYTTAYTETIPVEFQFIRPELGNVSIAAGENNYIISFNKGNKYYTYVWGSLMYSVRMGAKSRATTNNDYKSASVVQSGNSDEIRLVFETPYDGSANVRAVAGGYTVGINGVKTGDQAEGITSLSLRGKNFVSSSTALTQVDSSTAYTMARTAATQKKPYKYTSGGSEETKEVDGTSVIRYDIAASNSITVNGAVIGNYVSTKKDDNGIIRGAESDVADNGDLVMGRLASGSSASAAGIKFSTSAAARTNCIYSAQANADGTPVALNMATYSKPVYYDVALGYDVGYGIAGGKIYSWGDDTYGQSGRESALTTYKDEWAYPVPIDFLKEKTVISVAAGKQTSTVAKAFNANNTLTGSAGSYVLSDDVKNDGSTPYITGALVSDGSIVVWNKETRSASDETDYQTLYYGSDTKVNGKDKFAAVYSGYGNHLFAVTTLGKLVHITYDSAKSKFVQEIYDDFVVADLPMTNKVVDYAKAGDYSVKTVTTDVDSRVGDPINIDYRKLKNWTISSDTDNPVKFTVDSQVSNPTLGNMIIYLDNLKVSQTSIELHENITTEAQKENGLHYGGGDRGSIVTANGIGDVYRILDPDKGEVKFVNTTGTDGGSRSLTEDQLKLKFKLDGSEAYMTPAQIEHMFTYDIVYSSQYGVGIQITPERSSQECWVVVEFYVARYDSRANFRITNENPENSASASVTDEAIYYDYKPCKFRFKIDNTPAHRNEPSAFETKETEGDGNSFIPLLDPNNEYNNVYSVAVQDVSSGVEELASYLLTDTDNEDPDRTKDPSELINKIKDAMKLADRPDDPNFAADNTSFPASSRIAKGNLEYYFGNEENAKKYYSDKYQYLLTDRDADVLILNAGAVSQTEVNRANAGAVTAERDTVEIKDLDISSFGVIDENVAALATDFLNLYGLYNIKFTDSNKKLSFSYEIVRFTATGATGTLSYTGNDISRVNTTKTGNAYENINVAVTEYTTYDAANYTPVLGKNGRTGNFPNAFAVFSQPSLRLKARYSESGVTKYGKKDPDGKTDTVTETISNVRVGDTWTRSLGDYVEKVGTKSVGNTGTGSVSSAIYFSATAEVKDKDGKVTSYVDSRTDFSKFNSGFHDETNAGENIVTLTSDSITVKPTTAHPINFRVTIRRFHGPQNNLTFGDNEKITIIFNFVNIADFSLTLSGGKTSYSVDKQSSCDILGNGSTIEKLVNVTPAEYSSRIKINTPRSSNTNVLNVEKGKENTTFNVLPVASGKAVVQLVASLYDKSIVITLEFSVSGLTTIAGSVELIDTSYVYVNSLIGDLREANSFNTRINNYGVLFEDVDAETGRPNALYFTDESGNRLDGYPSFIKEVRFTNYSEGSSNPRIALIFDGETRDTVGKFFLCVRYVDTTKGYESYAKAEEDKDTILITRQLVRSAKHIVPGNNGEDILTIDINCDKPIDKNVSNPDDYWYTKGENTDMTIYVPVKMLMQKTGNNTPELFKGYLVTSSTDAANYFNYSLDSAGKNVLIHPLYDTPEPFMVNVSVRSTDSDSEQTSQVVSFRIKTEGISTTLTKKEYTTIWLVAFFASFGVLFIIFLIRMIVYWRRRAKQRALIKRNQELIRMRDRIHNKASAASREQIVRSKLKMEDPKYAKLFNEMKKDRQATDNNGVTLESMSSPSETADGKKGKKKKKGGKKSIAELKAELEAKKAAFAQAQNGDTVNNQPFGSDAPQHDFGSPDMAFDPNQNFGSPTDAFAPQDLDANSIIFDVVDDPGAQG